MNRAGGYISVAEICIKINAIIKLVCIFFKFSRPTSHQFVFFFKNKENFYRSLLINTVFFEDDFQRDRLTLLLQKSLQEQVDSNGGSESERRKSTESEPQSTATRLIYCRGVKNVIFTFKIKKAFLSFLSPPIPFLSQKRWGEKMIWR